MVVMSCSYVLIFSLICKSKNPLNLLVQEMDGFRFRCHDNVRMSADVLQIKTKLYKKFLLYLLTCVHAKMIFFWFFFRSFNLP